MRVTVPVKYEVVLPDRPAGNPEATARAMSDVFGIPATKAAALLARAPGVLTKAIDEREAVRVAYKLRRIGLAVEVRPVDVRTDVARDRRTPLERAAAAPAASRAHDATRAEAAWSDASAPDDSSPDTPTSASRARSPFLSQVDEAPPAVIGPDGLPMDGHEAPVPPAVPAAVEVPAAREARAVSYSESDAGAAAAVRSRARRAGPRAPYGRFMALVALIPGAVALLASWGAFALVAEGPAAGATGTLAGVAAGVAALAVAAAAAWFVGRRAAREHARVIDDVVRISRGDLGRPVEPSDRYPEAVQALERIRVSLQEGLERLRRRRR